MEKKEIRILGLYVGEPLHDKTALQHILTKYGNVIRTRIGLNQDCGTKGIILLELFGDDSEIANFEKALQKLEGIDLQSMIFK
jgi:hypothetical protein